MINPISRNQAYDRLFRQVKNDSANLSCKANHCQKNLESVLSQPKINVTEGSSIKNGNQHEAEVYSPTGDYIPSANQNRAPAGRARPERERARPERGHEDVIERAPAEKPENMESVRSQPKSNVRDCSSSNNGSLHDAKTSDYSPTEDKISDPVPLDSNVDKVDMQNQPPGEVKCPSANQQVPPAETPKTIFQALMEDLPKILDFIDLFTDDDDNSAANLNDFLQSVRTLLTNPAKLVTPEAKEAYAEGMKCIMMKIVMKGIAPQDGSGKVAMLLEVRKKFGILSKDPSTFTPIELAEYKKEMMDLVLRVMASFDIDGQETLAKAKKYESVMGVNDTRKEEKEREDAHLRREATRKEEKEKEDAHLNREKLLNDTTSLDTAEVVIRNEDEGRRSNVGVVDGNLKKLHNLREKLGRGNTLLDFLDRIWNENDYTSQYIHLDDNIWYTEM